MWNGQFERIKHNKILNESMFNLNKVVPKMQPSVDINNPMVLSR
ncbi:hypothetical protein LHK_01655 [Laribacter hongkongensis HLHK9]|uniref:Uncharacterized protein n=1 Tax=Laribacter hongkongensis (strain HLHK9) TaxID=557598 RepID=C1D851_LARHH|nr:hypothetical protein LHK_01655 [Laribacter hongkongensis HLHK9]